MATDIRLAFVFNPDNPYLCGKRYQVNFRKWFLEALPRAEGLRVDFITNAQRLDLQPVSKLYDAWLFFDAMEWGLPPVLTGVDKIKAVKVCHIGDAHGVNKLSKAFGGTKLDCCQRFGFDYYFFQHSPSYFYRHYPADFRYWWIPMGVDAELYREVKPWSERRFDKVLLTGCLGSEYYPLRTRLADHPMVRYEKPGSYSGWDSYAPGKWDEDRYKLLLEEWGASIASGYSVVNKYFEIPAAGCLTFAHIDGDNGCGVIEFDPDEVVLVNNATADAKIAEFLERPADPKWNVRAALGRNYVMENFCHDKTVQMLVEKLREAL
jgi:hypothetical protein